MVPTTTAPAPRVTRRRTERVRRRAQARLGVLIRSAGRGDRASFTAYYDLVVADSYGLALLSLGDARRAERATACAMVEAWRQSNRWVDQSLSPTAWLLALTYEAVLVERLAPA